MGRQVIPPTRKGMWLMAFGVWWCLGAGLCGVVAQPSGVRQSLRLDPHFRVPLQDINWWLNYDYSYVRSMILQENGQFIIAGRLNYLAPIVGEGTRSIARFNSDASLDMSFTLEGGGPELVAWNDRFYSGPYLKRYFLNGVRDWGFDLANAVEDGLYLSEYDAYHVDEDGYVLLAGRNHYTDPTGNTIYSDLVRLDSTGGFDTTFQPRDLGTSDRIYTIKAISGGRFILSGSLYQYEGVPIGKVVRIMANGELDPSFSPPIHWGRAYDARELPDGRVIIVGHFLFEGITDTLNVVRLMPDGSLDPSFNNAMRFEHESPFSQFPMVFAITPFLDGLYVIGGSFYEVDGFPRGRLVIIDADGTVVDDDMAVPGCGTHLANQFLIGSIQGVVQESDSSYLVYGSPIGYADDVAAHPLLRGVLRLVVVELEEEEEGPEGPEPDIGIFLYPNPALNELTIEGIPEGTHQFEVYDATGRQVTSFVSAGPAHTVQLASMAIGVYSIAVIDPEGRRSLLRFVVQ